MEEAAKATTDAVGDPTSDPIAKGVELTTEGQTNKWKWFLVGLALLAVAGIILAITLGFSSKNKMNVTNATDGVGNEVIGSGLRGEQVESGGEADADAEIGVPTRNDSGGSSMEPDASDAALTITTPTAPTSDGGVCGANPRCAPVDIYIIYDHLATETSYELKRLDVDATSGTTGGDGWDDDNEEEAYPPPSLSSMLIASHTGDNIKATHRNVVCLQPGKYQFTIYDHDGMCCNHWLGDGYYSVSLYDDTMIVEGAEFEKEESTIFDVEIDVGGYYNIAKGIVLEITNVEVLEGEGTTPQSRALQWIVCRDQISARLFHGVDVSTGLLPK